jgi:hypothetical protein
MVDTLISQLDDLRQSWTRAATSVVWSHWLMLDTGLQAAQTILAKAAPDAGTQRADAGGLLACALARVNKGLAPPREIYLAPYRGQIDWAKLPDWARPSDPELFDGCIHEG